jgi:hypothetical protein
VSDHTDVQNYDALYRSLEKSFDEKLQTLPIEIEKLVGQRQYFKALEICDAYLQPFEKGHVKSSANLKSFYLYYADLLACWHDPEHRQKTVKSLEKALQFFSNDQALREKKEDFEVSDQMMRDFNRLSN